MHWWEYTEQISYERINRVNQSYASPHSEQLSGAPETPQSVLVFAESIHSKHCFLSYPIAEYTAITEYTA